MHIFLTGGIQVGKTTLIKKYLSQSGNAADGFMTYWEPTGNGGRSLYLSPFSTDAHSVSRLHIAYDCESGLVPEEGMTDVFDVHGTEILNASGRRGVIVMDELGFLESKAAVFQQAVLRHISGSVPILGVIKPIKTKFLDVIRSHPGVVVREITPDNRDAALDWLLAGSGS